MESDSLTTAPGLRATIHLGASSVSMLVVEADATNPGEAVEFLEQPLPVARDVFGHGRLDSATTERAVEILLGYLESLGELGIGREQIVRAVASNILSEARNNETFLNRINIACGLDVEILDDGEMTRLIYLKTRRRLRDTPTMRKRTTILVHVGPGNTRVVLFKRGRINRYTSYRLGTHRTHEAVEGTRADGAVLLRVIREHISGQLDQLRFEYEDETIEDIVVIGYEVQLLAPFLSKPGDTRCPTKTLRSLLQEAATLSLEERVRRYQLDYHTAEAVIPALEINLAIAECFELKGLRIPDSDYERGLLFDLPISPSLATGFQAEVIRSAKILAQKFKVDAKHSSHVAFLAGRLFEETRGLHRLSDHDALLLDVASILHECGGFISPKAHHKHSQYIIENSEVFGLGRLDVAVVALAARYHRQSGPKSSHPAYAALSHEDRIRVAKIASLLRVADALDRSHTQRVTDLSAGITRNEARLNLLGVSDATVERLAMQSKGDVFQETFGLRINLAEHG